MPKPKTEWRRGEQARLAQWAGVTRGYLSDLLHRRKTASAGVAVKLAAGCLHMEIPLSLADWCQPEGSESPLWRDRA